MAELDLTSPLISPQTILTIHDDDDQDSDPSNNHQQYPLQTPIQTRIHNPNPYDFIGSPGLLSVPSSTTIDPFRNATPSVSGGYEVVKIVVCLPIALARLVLFGACLVIGYIATKIALAGWKDKHKPMPKWRSRIMWITRVCSRFILFSFGYHWIRRKGKPAPREIAPIVVSNHVSYIEPIFYFYELFPTIVASESHDSIPFVGTIIRAMQVIYVNRLSPTSRKNAVNEIKTRASCDTYPRLLLFPEGTTTNGKALISFQLGAFIAGHPIQPVIVRYPHVHFDQSWGLISLAKLMFRMFTQFHNFMEVEYLPIIMPTDHQKQNAVHFAERTGQAMANALNVVQTSHSYGDLMLLTQAAQLQQVRKIKKLSTRKPLEITFTGLIMASLDGGYVDDCISIFDYMKDHCAPNIGTVNAMLKVYGQNDMFSKAKELFEETNKAESRPYDSMSDKCGDLIPDGFTYSLMLEEKPWSYMVEMARIESLYHISSLEAMDFLDKFLSMNPDPSGCVELHDFLRVLQLKACTLSKQIFQFLDVGKNGSITFKQFLFGSAHVLNQPHFRQACELAFAECDADGDDYCTEKELADIIRQTFPDLNDDEVHGLFKLFDTDNDERISRDDFFYCLRKNPLVIAVFSAILLHKNLSKAGDKMLAEIV